MVKVNDGHGVELRNTQLKRRSIRFKAIGLVHRGEIYRISLLSAPRLCTTTVPIVSQKRKAKKTRKERIVKARVSAQAKRLLLRYAVRENETESLLIRQALREFFQTRGVNPATIPL